MQGIFMGVKLLDLRALKPKVLVILVLLSQSLISPFANGMYTPLISAIGFLHVGGKDQIYL